MKKKVIIPIVVGSICLLFGGLIYLGVSAFPELLLSEEQLKAQEVERTAFINRAVVNEEPSEGAVVIFSDAASDVVDNYIPSVAYEAEASYTVAKVETSNTASSKKIDFFESHPLFHEESNLESLANGALIFEQKEEPVIITEHINHSYTESIEGNVRQEVIKTKKARVSKNKSTRSNEAIVEASLLVIGAVDVLSMILIKRKKHLFR